MVLTSCSYVPLEIPLAIGMPAKRALFERTLPSCEALLPRDFCPYARAYVRQYAREDVIAVAGSCDAMRRVYDVLRHFGLARDVYFVDVPRTADAAAAAYYADVLRDFARHLLRAGSEVRGLDSDPREGLADGALSDLVWPAIQCLNSVRSGLARIFELEAGGWISGGVAIRAATRANEALGGVDAPEDGEPGRVSRGRMLRDVLEACQHITDDAAPGRDGNRCSVEGRGRRPEATSSEGRIRVGVSGTCLLEPSVVDSLEEAGFDVAFIDSCLARRMLDFRVPCGDAADPPSRSGAGQPDAFLALASAYLAKPPCPRMFSGGARALDLKRLVARSRAQGVVYFAPKFCDYAYYEFSGLKRDLGEGAGLPMLLVEGEHGSGRTGQIATRVAAFREMLEGRSLCR